MVAHEHASRLLSFNIRRPNRTNRANGLYANGNHQCEVIIDIVKQLRAADGTWVVALLTDEERSSVAVVEWSEQHNEKLPRGWSCDTQKNRYDIGLWAKESVNENSKNTVTEFASHPQAESVVRYLRCDLDVAVGPVRFMARIVIDGKIYTTHFSQGAAAFESSVTLVPEQPFYLDVRDLEVYEDNGAYFASSSNAVVMAAVYYWQPPAGVFFVENRGIAEPINLPGDGAAFDSSLSRTVEGWIGLSYKAGTLTNKNEIGQTLEIGELHQGLGVPDEHALVRFNERPTIMRAIKVISNLFVFPEHYERRPWRLLDNFGTEHTFTLEGDTQGNLYLRNASEVGSYYLEHFEIMLPNGQALTDALYSNGRHQCQVEVEVIMMQRRPDGSTVQAKLTDAQRNSLTLTRFSLNNNEPLPNGWSCDKEKNIYDLGLRNLGAETGVGQGQNVERETANSKRQNAIGSPKEVVNRYLRVDAGTRHERVRFMAVIDVDGVRYTTNYSHDDISFISYVTIGFVPPYRLWVSDLIQYDDQSAYDDFFCDIDVYYWTPRSGERFLVNRGLDSPLFLPLEGRSATSSYCLAVGPIRTYKGGIVYGKDVANPKVLVSDISKSHPLGGHGVVRFNERSTIMRAVRYRENQDWGVQLDHQSRWRLWDNYGCEQVYIIVGSDVGNLLGLKDG
ncbi:hypothetical protein [Pseudomonas salmasensis]|uniref:hypothetical protein n=1 Tax=Pseudomonas salmasensis TaxID=2745514 RepID=UPI001648D1FF|nr:hypothetical protein [Pseudomonas salmasensis]QXH76905.1 hypothetical protein HU731_021085 [Pseudomonas salmasensis]